MDFLMITLRLTHILAGVFWVGGVVMLAGYIEPTAAAVGLDSAKFMQRLMAGSLPVALSIAPPLNVLAGLIMYWRDSGGLNPLWITTKTGLVFTLGAVLGLIALFIGFVIVRPTVTRMTALGKEIGAAGKPPTQEQLGRMGGLQLKVTQYTLYAAIIVSLALAAMATARYF